MFKRTPGAGLRGRRIAVLGFLAVVTLLATSHGAAAASVPTAPPSVKASPGNASAVVRWTVPTSNGGSAITEYVVTPYLGTTSQPAKIVDAVTQTTVAGLTNARTYTFRVAARNAYGTGPIRSSPAVTVGAPGEPTDITARGAGSLEGAASAIVHWKAPTTTNGSAITGYLVTPYFNGVPYAARSFPASASAGYVTGFAFNQTYTFRVAAKNANGTGLKSLASPAVKLVCTGVAMTRGQADIDSHPENTTFCLTGTHNWTLAPKSGDTLIGPAVLDGAHTSVYAVVGNGRSNVRLSTLEIRNYHMTDGQAAISGHGTTGWIFRNLQVHDNGSAGGGAGAHLGVNSRVLGGRYYNNRQLGIGGGGGAHGWIINGAEIDHNNFTNNTYTTRNIDCGYQGGGVKWTADNTTVKNSRIHDNACKGLWADLNGDNTTITNNTVYGNWDEGIFIEISSGAVVTNNVVNRNGLRNTNGDGSGCPWLWGGGITLASSDKAVVAYNSLSGNCNGITGTQQNRSEGNPGLLQNLSIHHNTIVGPGGRTGVVADNGADLRTRNIVFTNNSISNHTFCNMNC